MLVEQVITYLEQTSSTELIPSRPVQGVTLDEVSSDDPLLRVLHDRVGGPHQWSSVSWPSATWKTHVEAPGMRCWIIRIGEAPAGLLCVLARGDGVTEIDMFGLVPEYVGRGFGGYALTLAVRLAWETARADGPVQKVMLRTSSLDHPNALPNYLRRGFRVVGTTARVREVPEGR